MVRYRGKGKGSCMKTVWLRTRVALQVIERGVGNQIRYVLTSRRVAGDVEEMSLRGSVTRQTVL